MKNRLYVGGISWGVDDDMLRDHFERFGAVRDVRVIRDRDTGRSRGFGFVTFENPIDASAAMDELDGSIHEGRKIRVSEAIQRQRPFRTSSYQGSRSRYAH